MPVSIQDVARKAGVSHTTVSQALREGIEEIVQRIGTTHPLMIWQASGWFRPAL